MKELLALVFAPKHIEIYMSSGGYSVTVYNGPQPFDFLHCLKNKNHARLLQWSILLHQYTLDIQHITGQGNVVADPLSRAAAGGHTPD